MKQKRVNTDNCKITYDEDSENTIQDLIIDLIVEYINDLHNRPVVERKC
jgi:hypothetical protein